MEYNYINFYINSVKDTKTNLIVKLKINLNDYVTHFTFITTE